MKKDFRFDKRAAKYDKGVEGKVSRRFYNLLLANIDLRDGMTVLDAGCGTGTVLRKMADTCAVRGYGIDMEENMIAEARAKCPEMDIRICKCESTPFDDGTFDVIVACMAYHHFSDRAGFAKEAARLLKSGGCLYIADPRLPFLVRKTLNGIFRLFRVHAFFGKPQEIAKNFEAHGFALDGVAVDKYAQVVKLKLGV